MNKKNKHINLINLFSIILIFVVLFIWCYKTLNKSDKSGGNEVNLDNDYYLVSFDSNGGESVDSVLVNAGNNVTMPIPTRKWYDFVSWKLNGKDYNFNTPVTDNITLVADWKVSSTIVLVNGVDLIPNTTAASAIKNNTIMLQRVIDLVSDNFSSGTSINKMQMALYLYNFNNL